MRWRSQTLVACAAAALAAAVAVGATLVLTGPPETARASRVVTTPTSTKRPSYLFAQDANHGTLVRRGGAGEYDLTLYGVHPNALYFRNRPGSETGSMPVEQLLKLLFAPRSSSEGPPNASINALVPARGDHQYLMGVTLLSQRYDKATATLRYHVRASKQGPPEHREHGRTDVVLPASFGHTSVFIDSDFFGNDCLGYLRNYTSGTLYLSQDGSTSKWPTDSWNPAPPASIPPGGVAGWESTGGASRGCTNYVEYLSQNMDWGIAVALKNPWNGNYSASCDVIGDNGSDQSGPYTCLWNSDTLDSQDEEIILRNWAVCSSDTGGSVDSSTVCSDYEQLPPDYEDKTTRDTSDVWGVAPS